MCKVPGQPPPPPDVGEGKVDAGLIGRNCAAAARRTANIVIRFLVCFFCVGLENCYPFCSCLLLRLWGRHAHGGLHSLETKVAWRQFAKQLRRAEVRRVGGLGRKLVHQPTKLPGFPAALLLPPPPPLRLPPPVQINTRLAPSIFANISILLIWFAQMGSCAGFIEGALGPAPLEVGGDWAVVPAAALAIAWEHWGRGAAGRCIWASDPASRLGGLPASKAGLAK